MLTTFHRFIPVYSLNFPRGPHKFVANPCVLNVLSCRQSQTLPSFLKILADFSAPIFLTISHFVNSPTLSSPSSISHILHLLIKRDTGNHCVKRTTAERKWEIEQIVLCRSLTLVIQPNWAVFRQHHYCPVRALSS